MNTAGLRTKSSKFDLLNAVHYLRLGYQSMSLDPAEAHDEALAVIARAGDDKSKQVTDYMLLPPGDAEGLRRFSLWEAGTWRRLPWR